MQNPNSPSEEWRAVVGYEGFYEVSSDGRVRRVKMGMGVKNLGHPLKPLGNGRGYLGVGLSANRVKTRHYIHRLVAAAFIGPCPQGHEVNHKDGDKTNNCASNLEYVTASENRRHAFDTGLRPTLLGEDDVRAIRQALTGGGRGTATRLAKKYEVSPEYVRAIAAGRVWKHVD